MSTCTLCLVHNPPGKGLLVQALLIGKLGQAAQIVLLRQPIHFRIAPNRILRKDLSGNIGVVQQRIHVHGGKQGQRCEEGSKLLRQCLRLARCAELAAA